MNKIQQPNILSWGWAVCSALSIFIVTTGSFGCSSPGRTIHATATATVESVDIFMADYSRAVSAGTVSVEQEAKVKAGWEAYQKASLAGEAAIKLYIAASNSDAPTMKGRMEEAVKTLDSMRDELLAVLKGIL